MITETKEEGDEGGLRPEQVEKGLKESNDHYFEAVVIFFYFLAMTDGLNALCSENVNLLNMKMELEMLHHISHIHVRIREINNKSLFCMPVGVICEIHHPILLLLNASVMKTTSFYLLT